MLKLGMMILPFIFFMPRMSSVTINATKKAVVDVLLTIEKTLVILAVFGEKSGKLFNIMMIPKFSA